MICCSFCSGLLLAPPAMPCYCHARLLALVWAPCSSMYATTCYSHARLLALVWAPRSPMYAPLLLPLIIITVPCCWSSCKLLPVSYSQAAGWAPQCCRVVVGHYVGYCMLQPCQADGWGPEVPCRVAAGHHVGPVIRRATHTHTWGLSCGDPLSTSQHMHHATP